MQYSAFDSQKSISDLYQFSREQELERKEYFCPDEFQTSIAFLYPFLNLSLKGTGNSKAISRFNQQSKSNRFWKIEFCFQTHS